METEGKNKEAWVMEKYVLFGAGKIAAEFLGQKIKDVPSNQLSWDSILLKDVVGSTKYPEV